MSQILNSVADFFNGSSILVYILIFVGKIAEVSLATLRIVLIGRGERLIGSIVAIFEVSIWLVVTSSVLIGFRDDFIKVIVFVTAFAVGNFTGSYLEEILAVGLCSLRVVVPDENSLNRLTELLRNHGFGVTALEAKGLAEQRFVLLLTVKRKRSKEALALIKSNCENAVITVSDVKSQEGGYFKSSLPRRILFK